jgi:DHA1 family tetracycline resistance protein-like MFS transporter
MRMRFRPRHGKAAIGFIFLTLLIDVTGFGIIIPVLPTLISTMLDIPINEASTYGGWLTAAYAVMQFGFAPVLGNLSDRFGRRPVLLISLFGFFLDYLILSFAPNYIWLVFGRLLAGVSGASITTASAYIADISAPENRAKNFGMIGAAFGLGFIVGPAIGGLLGEFGTRVPFYAAAGLTFLNWLYGYFILPESLPLDQRRPFEWKRANPLGAILHLRKYPALSGLFLAFTLIYISAHAIQSNWSYYTMYLFNWSEGMVGISLALVGLLVAIVQGGLIRWINPWLGDRKSVYIGLLLYAIGMVLFGIANASWMMFAFLVPYCLGGIAGPALQSIMTGQVQANQQGELQGTLTSLMSMTTIFGPPLMTGLFALFTGANAPAQIPGMPFLLGAVLLFASAGIAYVTLGPGKGKSTVR